MKEHEMSKMTSAPLVTETIPWHGHADQTEIDRWSAVAQQVADTLAKDVWERDQANETPHREAQLLKDSGLVTLLDPAELGGGGAHWETAFRVVRILSRTDSSIGQLLGYHYVNEGNIVFDAPTDEVRDRWLRRTIDHRWVWGDSVNPVDPGLTLSAVGDDYVLTGHKRFSTGSAVGDVIVVNALAHGGRFDGQIVAFVLEHGREGVEYVDDWDFLGQRLSSSNTVRYHDVRVTPDDVIGSLTDEPFATLLTPGIQLAFGNIYVGLAEGAIAKGAEITRARKNAWFLSKADLYRDDPFIQRLYGELDSRTAAVAALAEKVSRSYDTAIDRGHALTADERGRIAIEIARLKVASSELATDATNRVFEATGSSSTRTGVGLDLFWRNARTHSLHDPIDYKKLEVGAYLLNRELQPLSLYT
jgi:alkylation response protein AidB-like acyl-CoA dehydrogenase